MAEAAGRKALLITGCSSGIGYTAAKELAARGYQVFAGARKSADVQRLMRDGLHAVQLDLEDPSSMDLALQEIFEITGNRLYGLVANAAFAVPGAIEDLSRDTLRHQFETNVFGTMELINKVLPTLREQGDGRIVVISSILGRIALRFRGAYNGSKFALEGLCRTLRQELDGSGIHVSLVNPGQIESKFRENAIHEFEVHVTAPASRFQGAYTRMRELASEPGGRTPVSVPASAVVNVMIDALEARTPKLRYYVTGHAKLLAFLDRVLPERWMEKILLRI